MRVDAGGVRLWVDDYGPRGAQAIVALHGFTGSSATWASLARRVPSRRLLAFDLIGHGRSEAPDDPERYTFEACVAQLHAALDRLGVARAAWLGYSLGGRVALAAALAAPQRVGALVVESCTAGIADAGQRAARRAADDALAERILKDGVPAFVDAWLAQPLLATQRRLGPAALERARAERLEHSATGLANALRGLGQGAMVPLWEQLPRLRAPALLVSGTFDAAYTATMARMAAAIPAARHAAVPDAGHAVHLEQPDSFAAEVLQFLAASSP